MISDDLISPSRLKEICMRLQPNEEYVCHEGNTRVKISKDGSYVRMTVTDIESKKSSSEGVLMQPELGLLFPQILATALYKLQRDVEEST